MSKDIPLTQFIAAASEIAGGADKVEDYKFVISGTIDSPDDILEYATKMLQAQGKELREC